MNRVIERAPLSYPAAAAAGGVVCALEFTPLLMTPLWTNPPNAFVALATVTVAMMVWWFLSAVVFFLGLIFVATPVSALLAAASLTSRRASIAAGALLSATFGGLLTTLAFPSANAGMLGAAFMLIPGAVAGWILHRVTYGRPT